MLDKEKRDTDTVLAVSDDFAPWPLDEKEAEKYAVAKDDVFTGVLTFLEDEILDSTRNVREQEEFIKTLAPVVLGSLHGAGIGPVSGPKVVGALNEILKHEVYADFLEQKQELAPLLAYSLLVGKYVESIPPAVIALF